MTPIIRIEHIAGYDGQEVTLRGWLQLKTGKGKLQFLRLRDGTGIIQAVVFRGNVSEEAFEAAKRVSLESSLIVTGVVKADHARRASPAASRWTCATSKWSRRRARITRSRRRSTASSF